MLAKALADHPDAVAVCPTLSETSTGVGHDIEAFGKIVAKTPALCWSTRSAGWGRWSAGPTIGTSTSAAPARKRR